MPKSSIENIDATFQENSEPETVTQVKEEVAEAGWNLQAKIDEARGPAAEKIQNAAAALHEKAGTLPGGATAANLAHKTADTMQATAEYVREHEVQKMMADVGAFARRHAGKSLLAAAAVGFLIGRKFRSNA